MRFQCPQCQSKIEVSNDRLGQQVQCGNCGKVVTVPENRFANGVVIGNDFRIDGEIAKGGMGMVYKAYQISLDRPAALKVLLEEFITDPEYVNGFVQEARAAAKLNHPNMVQAYAVGIEDGIYYFAMEFVPGDTMKTILKREKKLPFSEAADVTRQVAAALGCAWTEQKLIHRDIKPDNMIKMPDGRVKLADLGLSQIAGAQQDASESEVLGTPQYISPEQLTGAALDTRSDLYSLGATLYQFVTGKYPYSGKDGDEVARQHLTGTLRPPREVNPKVPKALEEIILKLMQRNPDDRFQTPKELEKALKDFLDNFKETPETANDYDEEAEKGKKKKRNLIIGAGAGGVGILLILLILALVLREDPVVPGPDGGISTPVPGSVGGRTVAPTLRPGFADALQGVLNMARESEEDQRAFLVSADDFLGKFGQPENELEEERLKSLLLIYNPIDETLLVIPKRSELVKEYENEVNDFVEAKREHEEAERQLEQQRQEMLRVAAENRAMQIKVSQERLAQMKQRCTQCLVSFMSALKNPDEAKSWKRKAQNEIEVSKRDLNALVENNKPDGEMLVTFLQELVNEFDAVQALTASLRPNGGRIIGTQLDLPGNQLWILRKIEGTKFTFESEIKLGEMMVWNLNKITPENLKKLSDRIDKRMKSSNVLFFYLMSNGLLDQHFSVLTPEGFWTDAVEAFAQLIPELSGHGSGRN